MEDLPKTTIQQEDVKGWSAFRGVLQNLSCFFFFFNLSKTPFGNISLNQGWSAFRGVLTQILCLTKKKVVCSKSQEVGLVVKTGVEVCSLLRFQVLITLLGPDQVKQSFASALIGLPTSEH